MAAENNAPDILVVDDDAGFREVMAFNLTEAGYSVRSAANGVEGLELFKAMPVRPSVVHHRS